MKLSPSVPYLIAVSAITLGSMGLTTGAQASSPHSAAVPYSIRLEDQFLAELHYLPVTFVPTTSTATTTTTTTTPTTTTTTTLPTSTSTSTTTTTTTSTTLPTTTTTTPSNARTAKKKTVTASKTAIIPGSFVWRFSSLPAVLRSQWRVGTDNVVLQGALMNFQNVHGLTTTGSNNGPTWQALVAAVLEHHDDPSSYNYVYVSKTLPESVKLYQNGRLTFKTVANTGISDAPTENGTYPVYLRFTVTTMSGSLPDGQPYDDTGIPWVSYFHGGDALHGFIRSSYGFPQSLGCVEMPFNDAAKLWPRTPIGTLVTVQ
jgi:L,D-transpeptidase catalytic domain